MSLTHIPVALAPAGVFSLMEKLVQIWEGYGLSLTRVPTALAPAGVFSLMQKLVQIWEGQVLSLTRVRIAPAPAGVFSLMEKLVRRRGGAADGGPLSVSPTLFVGDVEESLREAGSGVLHIVLQEVSDAMMRGVESDGLPGVVSGSMHVRRYCTSGTLHDALLHPSFNHR